VKGDLRETAQLGEVVAAAFDIAARLVARAVAQLLSTERVRTTSSRWRLSGKRRGRGQLWLIPLVFAATIMGCTSVQLRADQLEHFEASMRYARSIGVYKMSPEMNNVGALGMAPAKEHLFLAADEADVAKTMAAAGNRRSSLLLARAQSDVDLALEFAKVTALRRQTRRAVDDSKGTQVDDAQSLGRSVQPQRPWR